MSDHKDVQHVLHTVNLNITLNLMNNGVEATVNGRRDNLEIETGGAENSQDVIQNHRALKARYEEHKSEYFDMSKKPKGKVLVINNDFSYHSKQNRENGSEQDVINLEQAFKQLGGKARGSRVDINIIRNLSSKGIEDHMQLFIKESNEIPSFVAIVIMSHGTGIVGGKDFVCGNDNSLCSVGELVKLFKSKPEWKEVPVMMFLQMCRGTDRGPSEFQDVNRAPPDEDTVDCGPDTSNHESIEDKLQNSLRTALPGCEIIGPNDDLGEDQAGARTGDDDQIQFPAWHYAGQEPNMLISFASSEGRAAILNKVKGSWFIQELCNAIEKCSTTKNMIEIMREVHENVNRKRSGKYKELVMACDSAHTFEKKFEFFPGFPEK